MKEEKRYLADIGMKDLPFPMRVVSRVNKNGQYTVADISISARIMHEFDATWIDKFIQPAKEILQATTGTSGFSAEFWGARTTDVLGQAALILAGVFAILSLFKRTARPHAPEGGKHE